MLQEIHPIMKIRIVLTSNFMVGWGRTQVMDMKIVIVTLMHRLDQKGLAVRKLWEDG